MTVTSYKDLDVWQKAMDLVTEVYALTKGFPRDELYGLTSQMRRAAVSIPSNIAEGRGKRSTGDFMRFLNIAYGSAAELETQIIISENLGYTDQNITKPLIEETNRVCRMLNGLITSLEAKASRIPNPESRIPESHA